MEKLKMLAKTVLGVFFLLAFLVLLFIVFPYFP
ncbi:MAG: hypothetical protein UV74_C0013G0057 [Candidatus Woesebacteria bacterium GW2011_GWB1_43_14]|uniref:Uncharacterized protein n=1 Tax=Candidatus Woesebacteria bacterium GW2011_GWB1_43_14 TaxID=1618578 RepID=A0A0G1DGA4_9BACT|nr:MAG: hypothetical protein UT21_C0004G0002 [Candidatus Woesebacteria bacterium GW2011_GWA1_39_11b]KKS77757.1 MAG: hypothetical protein UV51_C0005G0167 [Candidatus Woesebacteria bacterium GW2011_GWC1_42_9]KKS96935.1 MAG: hypothetical protein UV74_C0013G0057 [Candidatus Woesebacteria bacterium GW2011_GWB1_43_14]